MGVLSIDMNNLNFVSFRSPSTHHSFKIQFHFYNYIAFLKYCVFEFIFKLVKLYKRSYRQTVLRDFYYFEKKVNLDVTYLILSNVDNLEYFKINASLFLESGTISLKNSQISEYIHL